MPEFGPHPGEEPKNSSYFKYDFLDAPPEPDEIAQAVTAADGPEAYRKGARRAVGDYHDYDAAEELARVGDIEGALALAHSSELDTYRDDVLYMIVLTLAEKNEVAEAQGVANKMQAEGRGKVEPFIAAAQARSGDPESAWQTISAVKPAEISGGALEEVVMAFAQAGEADRVEELIASSENNAEKFFLYANSAEKLAAGGNHEAAMQLAERVPEQLDESDVDPFGFVSYSRANVLSNIAQEESGRGDFELAKKTAGEISTKQAREKCFVKIAAAQAAAGDIARARETAAQLSSFAEDGALVQIARRQIEAQDLDEARVTVESLHESDRNNERLTLVLGRVKSGDLEGAWAEAQDSRFDSNRGIVDFEFREAVGNFAKKQALAGDIEGLQRTEEFLHQKFDYGVGKDLLPLALAQSGQLDRALEAVDNLGEQDSKNMALRNIAIARIKAEDWEGAHRSAEMITFGIYREDLLLEIGHGQLAAGNVAGAQSLLKEMTESDDRLKQAGLYKKVSESMLPANAEQEAVAAQSVGEDRSLYVNAFWHEIAVDPAVSYVMASKLESAGQAAAALKGFDIASAEMGVAEKAAVFSGFLRDIWATQSESSPVYVGEAGRKLKLLTNLDSGSNEYYQLFENNVRASDLAEHPWLTDIYLIHTDPAYPIKSGLAEQHRFLADHSQVPLTGFNRSTMGKFIYGRLDAGHESNMHDATVWLGEFALNEDKLEYGVYDAARIKENGTPGGAMHLEAYKEKLWDETAAKELIAGMFNMPDEHRLRLPGHNNPAEMERYSDILLKPEYMIAYRVLLEAGADHLPLDILLDRAVETALEYRDDEEEEFFRKSKERPAAIRAEHQFGLEVKLILTRAARAADDPDLDPPAKNIGLLKGYAKNRKAYTDDATTWLQRHANLPQYQLSKAWENRPLALADGVPDSARAIETWAQTNALRLEAQRRADADGVIHEVNNSFDIRRLDEDMRPYVDELSRVYGAGVSLNAILELESKPLPEPDIAPATLELEGGYIFEVFDKADPRGFTIGVDTGCCMTLEGVSAECIWAGYHDSRYGFAALYGPDKRLQAQSLVYHGEDDDAQVLVLDNIEANAGRDLRKVRERYIEALEKYLGEDGPGAGKWNRVHVGEGYSDVSLGDLPPAQPVPSPLEDIYSDSYRQRLLYERKT